jgi:hypothetical protein
MLNIFEIVKDTSPLKIVLLAFSPENSRSKHQTG